MCLLAGHAGRGLVSVVLTDSRSSRSERNVQAPLPAHNLTDHPRVSRTGTARLQAASSCFTARSHAPQLFCQLTCTANCSCLAAKYTGQSGAGKVAAVQKSNCDANPVVDGYPVGQPLTALACLGAILQILTAQPSSAEVSLQNATSAAVQHQQWSVHRTTPETLELAESSKAAFTEQDDPVNPFTLFGNTRKKFLIENLDGTKVVSRKKGFTTTTCVSGVAIGQQTKRFEALPESAKSDAADNQLCSKTTGPDLEQTCNASCAQACTAALREYADRDSRLTGYSIDSKTKDKLAKSCVKQCSYQCAKPGDKYGFAIPYRSRE